MTARQAAIEDIKDDLRAQGKCFIAFRSKLNPIMRKLVSHQIMEQQHAASPFQPLHTRACSQLIAHCFFAKGQAILNDYTEYFA